MAERYPVRTADEIREAASAWAELRQWAHHESDEGLNILRRDDKGHPDHWVFLGDEGEWEEQQKFAREVAETFGLPLIVITWDDENEDVERVEYDPPTRAREAAAVKTWREALKPLILDAESWRYLTCKLRAEGKSCAESCRHCGPLGREDSCIVRKSTAPVRDLLDAQPPAPKGGE